MEDLLWSAGASKVSDEWQKNHLGQAKQTPFGTGEGYNILHSGHRFENMEKVISGNFSHKFGEKRDWQMDWPTQEMQWWTEVTGCSTKN